MSEGPLPADRRARRAVAHRNLIVSPGDDLARLLAAMVPATADAPSAQPGRAEQALPPPARPLPRLVRRPPPARRRTIAVRPLDLELVVADDEG
jgi:hypothetical protein